jgi:hypothetical protein
VPSNKQQKGKLVLPTNQNHKSQVRGPDGRFLPQEGSRRSKRKKKAGTTTTSTTPAATIPQSTPVPTTQLLNRFVICLDSSGSMEGIRRAAVDAFNNNVTSIRDGAKAANQKATVGLITFGESFTPVSEKYFDCALDVLKPLTYNDYRPQSNTPLFDAVGLAIERLRSLPDSKETSYVILVVTDGEENASRKYSAATLRNLMAEVTATDRWSFAFLVPPGRKWHLVQSFGIPEGNVREWETTSAGMSQAATAVSAGVASFYQARTLGKTSTRGFFVTDLSKVDTTQVQRQLTDLRDKVKIWTVDKGEVEIRTFVESHNLPYVKGNAYYQLTKDEKVQSYKNVLLVEKGKGAVYGGADARFLLNLPTHDVKVRPGNHANWDVFVQSTSTNRKLVRGTKLVYFIK